MPEYTVKRVSHMLPFPPQPNSPCFAWHARVLWSILLPFTACQLWFSLCSNLRFLMQDVSSTPLSDSSRETWNSYSVSHVKLVAHKWSLKGFSFVMLPSSFRHKVRHLWKLRTFKLQIENMPDGNKKFSRSHEMVIWVYWNRHIFEDSFKLFNHIFRSQNIQRRITWHS